MRKILSFIGAVVVTMLLVFIFTLAVYLRNDGDYNSNSKEGLLIDIAVCQDGIVHVIWQEEDKVRFGSLGIDDVEVYRTKNIESTVVATYYKDRELCFKCTKPAIVVYLSYDHPLSLKRL